MWRSLILLAAITLALIQTRKSHRLFQYIAAEFWATVALEGLLFVTAADTPVYLYGYIAIKAILFVFLFRCSGIHPAGVLFASTLAVVVYFSCKDRTIYCFLPLAEGALYSMAGVSGTFHILAMPNRKALAVMSVMWLLLGGWNFLLLLGLEPLTNFWVKTYIVAASMLCVCAYSDQPINSPQWPHR